MRAASHAAPDSGSLQLAIERLLDAPRELVFRAWTETDRAAQWWAPEGFKVLSCEMDARPGGAWRIRMRSPQATTHTKRGVFREVSAPERLVFTFAWEDADGRAGHETLVTLHLAAEGERTRLTLRHTGFATSNSCDAHECRWISTLRRLAGWVCG